MSPKAARRDSRLRRLGFSLLLFVLPRLYDLWMRLTRLTSREIEVRAEYDLDRQGQPAVVLTLHQSLLYVMHYFRDRGGLVMASRSRDGELVSALLEHMGFEVARGSDSRGGVAALREMIRWLETSGRSAALTADGPRGPYGEVKLGILKLAQASGLPVVPCAVWAHPSRRLGSWDRTLVPLPFSRIVICFGEPVRISQERSWAEVKQLGSFLEERMVALVAEARDLAESGTGEG